MQHPLHGTSVSETRRTSFYAAEPGHCTSATAVRDTLQLPQLRSNMPPLDHERQAAGGSTYCLQRPRAPAIKARRHQQGFQKTM